MEQFVRRLAGMDVRVVVMNGNTWYTAVDVVKALGIASKGITQIMRKLPVSTYMLMNVPDQTVPGSTRKYLVTREGLEALVEMRNQARAKETGTDNISAASTQLFDFAGTPVTVITDESGNPWWIGKEVCDILELTVRDSVRYLDPDEKRNVPRKHLGLSAGKEMPIINEPGLYSLILRSRKQAAKEFKRWVTHEVLPAIRKTGGYMTPEKTLESLRDPKVLIGMLEQMKDLHIENGRLVSRMEENQTVAGFIGFHLENYYSHGMKVAIGRRATQICRDLGIEVGVQYRELPSGRPVTVNTYPKHVLEQAFADVQKSA